MSNITKPLRQVFKQSPLLNLTLAVAVIAVVALSLIPPQILRYTIDNNLTKRISDGLPLLAAAYVGVVLLSGVFDFIKEAALTVYGQKIALAIRMEMMEKLVRITAMFFSLNSSGAIVSRFTNDVDAINSLFTNGIISMLVDCFKIIGIIASIWIFSAKLGVVSLILLPAIYAVTRLFQKRMLKAQITNRILVGKVNNHISESLKNMRMIKSYGKEGYMERNYVGYLMDNYKTVEQINFYDAVFSPIIQLTRAMVIAFIVVLSNERLNFLGISLGMVAASIELISNIFAPVENLGMEIQSIQQAVSGVSRVNSFLSEPEDDAKKSDITASQLIQHRSDVHISFNNVSFSYDETTNVLTDISLSVGPNENITFVGRTGVGKSTLFKLIMGLLKPTHGSITINGVDVYDIPNSEKRRIFGYVDQNFYILKGTVADQVSLMDENITRQQIENALIFVGLMDYVDTLDNGIETLVTSDALFSQGQKQLLAIARAVVTNPPILLFDEITASLDSITEEKIVSVLQKASSTHTIFTISHRLSSMVASDTVVILENGRVRSYGPPEDLLRTDDWYRSHIALERLTWN